MIAGTLWLIIVNTAIFFLGVIIWKKTWVSRFGVRIPGYSDTFESFSSIYPVLKNAL